MKMTHAGSALDRAGSHLEWTAIPRQAGWLGYAGLIPFLVLATSYLLYQDEAQQRVGQALVNYGAVIISFLGATHWGAVVGGASVTGPGTRLQYAVAPALTGWLATLLPLAYGLSLILVSLCAIYLVDRRCKAFDGWYLVLRGRLTVIASLSIAVALIFTYRSL